MPISSQYAFFRGKIVPIEVARIPVTTSALHYGTAVFEGLRAYWNPVEERLFVFRLADHVERLEQNARILHMQLGLKRSEVERAIVALLRREELRTDAYVRPLLYTSACEIGPKLVGYSTDLVIFTTPFGRYLDTAKGIRCVVSSWRRPSDNSVPPRGKIAGAYVNSALAKTEAILAGADEAILLTERGTVSEGSAENLFIVRGKTLITPPLTEDILEGITRATVIEIAAEAGILVIERVVNRTELYVSDEVFLCGTACEIAPVIEIDRRPIGAGRPGGVTRSIAKRFEEIVRGQTADHTEWRTPVPA